MRSRALRGLIALFMLVAPAAAQNDGLQVGLEPPEDLVEGRRGSVVAVVDVPEGLPVLVTPTGEGTAVDVVRGRLLRADALAPDDRPLRFRIPIVARSPGTGVVRVHVASFRCNERDECTPVEAEARVTLRVRPAPD